jgi:hypothetical protein
MKIRALLAAALLVLAAACSSPTAPSATQPDAPRHDDSGTMGPDNRG